MAGVRVRHRNAGRALGIGLVVLFVTIAGCRGDRSSTSPPPSDRGAEAPAADHDAYELDVIVEAEPDEGAPPLTVRFLGYVEEDEGGPWRFDWDFGDGATSAERNPTHTYTTVGDYTATLTATDQRGNTGTDEIDVFVETED